MKGLDFLKKLSKNSQDVRVPVYFFYGEEDFLIDRAIEKIGELCGCNSKLLFFGDEAKFDDIVRNFQETGLFDTSKKFVVLKKAEKFKNLKKLVESKIWKTTAPLILVCQSDKRVCLKKISDIESIFVVEFELLDRNVIKAWVRKKLQKENVEFDERTLETLISILPPSLRKIDNELIKILLYIGDKKLLTLEDIFSVVTPYEEARAYRLYNLVKKGEIKNALKELDILESSGVQPRNMVSYLASVYRRQVQQGIKESRVSGSDFKRFKKLISVESELRSKMIDENLKVELTILELIMG